MSDTSPWGTPPPSNPYGTPAQPPQQPGPPPGQTPAQPPYNPGGYDGGPPSYGVPLHGPGGPQGPKKRTGLILGIVAAVVLVIAAFAITLVVASGDDSPEESVSDSPSDTPGESDSPSDSETPSETDTPSESDTPSDDTSTPVPQTGDTITGTGYTYQLPGVGWTDATDEAGSVAPTIDSVIVLGSSIQLSQSNIIIEAVPDGGATALEDLEGVWKRNLVASDGATTEDIDESTIAGERAIGVRINGRTNQTGDPINQIAYLTLHGGQQYSIGLSYPAQGDSISVGDFEKVLDSWAWTS